MLDRLLKFEEQLARIEALLLVFFVLLMLGLAVYNVFYRNVLVPVQLRVLTEDVSRVEPSAPPDAVAPTVEPAAPGEDVPAEGAEGFGGGFDDSPAAADEAPGDAAGFAGGFEEPAVDAPAPAGGFAGGFGDPAPETPEPEVDSEPTEAADGFAGGFGGGFEPDTGEGSEVADEAPAPPAVVRAPVAPGAPKEVPFIAKAVDALKIEWIDVLLRQLVLVVGFLGAMLATRRRKHITIDALSKLLSDGTLHKIHVLTNLVSLVVCVLLVLAGIDLVEIGLQYPNELMSWAMEWQFQLVFPIGFGLLALHFAIRVVESTHWALGLAEPEAEATAGGAP